MERFGGIFLIAGLAFFGFAFLVMALVPYLHFKDLPVHTVAEVVDTVMDDFRDLETREPETFKNAFPAGATKESAAIALQRGHDIDVAEACWHCHSQLVRRVSNEDVRFGKISYPGEYQNELQMPPLMGTRRVGPDLIRQAGVHTNDWHIAHFYNPRAVSPTSVMPKFSWFFDESGERPVPNKDGFSIITYVQWLGSWIPEDERLD